MDQVHQNMDRVHGLGKPKTLTPGCRPPLWTRPADYPRTGPRTTPTNPLTDHPQNSIKKNKNKDFTYRIFDRSLVSAKFRALHWENCNRLTIVTILYICKYKTPKTMFKCCFGGEDICTDGKREESSYLLFVA